MDVRWMSGCKCMHSSVRDQSGSSSLLFSLLLLLLVAARPAPTLLTTPHRTSLPSLLQSIPPKSIS